MMARPAGRLAQPGGDEKAYIALILGAIGLVSIVGVFWIGAIADPRVRDQAGSVNPVDIAMGLASGTVRVGLIQVIVTVLLFAVMGFVAVLIARRSRASGRTWADTKARSMSRAQDWTPLFRPGAEEDAKRLHADHAGPGSPLGDLVNNGRAIFSSWEWVQVWIMGPRAGKTTCVVVPQILETTGPVVATSNKRDIVDLTRGPRSAVGVPWVFDVQGIIGEPPKWWWNPLTFVTDTQTAQKLTDIFISSATSAGARQDAYFEGAAKEALAAMFQAAAVGNRPITDVFRWANEPNPEWYLTNQETNPVRILAEAGLTAAAEALSKAQQLPDKQRDGVFGTMRPWLSVLGNERIIPWIVDDGSRRPHFEPKTFVTSTDTLYLVSKEGGGTARALTGALMMAVFEAGEEIAAHSRGGRLPTPLAAVLDEVANVARWRELPDVYSHYGSRGIIISAFFQSWAQGVDAFGENAMNKLWSAANVRGVGRGIAEQKFLSQVDDLIGPHDVVKRTTQTQNSGMGVSRSKSVQREKIFEVSELGSLPAGRAVLFVSGQRPGLLKLKHFSAKDYHDEVIASKDYYESLAVRAPGGAL